MTAKRTDSTGKKILVILYNLAIYLTVAFFLTAPLH